MIDVNAVLDKGKALKASDAHFIKWIKKANVMKNRDLIEFEDSDGTNER